MWAGDAAKINYFTPRINGFQLGVSYAPENCALDGGYTGACGTYNDLFATENDPGEQSEIWDVGANYYGDLGDMSLALSVGYNQGSLELAADGSEDRSRVGCQRNDRFRGVYGRCGLSRRQRRHVCLEHRYDGLGRFR